MADIYGVPKVPSVRREPIRPAYERAQVLPGRTVERVGRQLTASGLRWQEMLEDQEKEKQSLELNERLGEMMREWTLTHLPTYTAREGSLAVGMVDEASEQLRSMGEKGLTGLSPWASAQAKTRWENYTLSELSGLANREAKQRAVAKFTSEEELITRWAEAVAHTPTDKTFAMGLKEIGATLTQALDEGFNLEEHPMIAKRMRDAKELLIIAQVGSLIDKGELKKADFYLKKWSEAPEGQRPPLSKEAQIKLRALYDDKNKEQKDDLELISDQDDMEPLMKKARDEDWTLGQLEDEIRRKFKGAKEERMIKYGRDRYNSYANAKLDAEAKLIEAATNKVREIYPPGPTLVTSESEKKIQEILKTIPEKYHTKFLGFVQQQIYNDPVTAATNAAMDEWYNMTPDQKLSMTPKQLQDLQLRLRNEDYDIVKKQFYDIRNSKTGMTALSWDERRKYFVDDVIDPGEKTADAKLQRNRLNKALDQAYEIEVGKKGAPLTGPEQDRVINGFSETATVGGLRWFGRDTTMTRWEAIVHEDETVRARWKESAMRATAASNPAAVLAAIEADPRMRIWRDGFIARYRANWGSDPSEEVIVQQAVLIRQSGEIPQ